MQIFYRCGEFENVFIFNKIRTDRSFRTKSDVMVREGSRGYINFFTKNERTRLSFEAQKTSHYWTKDVVPMF